MPVRLQPTTVANSLSDVGLLWQDLHICSSIAQWLFKPSHVLVLTPLGIVLVASVMTFFLINKAGRTIFL